MIESFLANRDYAGLLQACEDYEIQWSTGADTSMPLSTIYTAFLAAYIITDDLQTTRFVRKRMLATASNQGWTISEETNRMWEVCKALLVSDHACAYELLMNSANWRPQLHQLVADIMESLRERMTYTLSQVYSNISLNDTIKYFCLPENDLIQALEAKGWTYDQGTQLFAPSRQDITQRTTSSFTQISNVADIVLHLDKF
ncbi:hypothetical protein DM01DRAFT_1409177 [Hesseltinella vesiculosa]|uniref:CSN8/PSMD8/EIF3K domain-containing protein n=1 Tax=Hesseltinella vesiculosa TaxID=101127 RepID=A0A1X2GC02_9FUNG|nr:hypothetical protein DM01DRAFT_1409177 [Hesseltinella vesiculosa]